MAAPGQGWGPPCQQSHECFNRWNILEIAEEKPVLGPMRLGWGDRRRGRGEGRRLDTVGCPTAWPHPRLCVFAMEFLGLMFMGSPRSPLEAPRTPPASAGRWARPATPHNLEPPSPHCLQAPDGGVCGNLVCAAA